MENPKNVNSSSGPVTDSASQPRHWIGPEELEAGYWSKPEVREQRGQEFFVKPVEWLEQVDKTDTAGLARREFLTVMGASMAMASLACARRPVHKIIPYVVKPEEVTPGEATWYATTWKDGGLSAGVLAKVREGRPIKLEGNPDDPLNRGALSARAQASLLSLYDTDRIKGPIARVRADGSRRKEVTWKELDTLVGDRLGIAKGGKVRILTGEIRSDSTQKLIKEFLAPFASGAHLSLDVTGMDDVTEGQQLSYGSSVVPNYHLESADVVVSFGADFLGSWNAPVPQAADWIKTRKLAQQNPGSAKMSKLFVVESMMSVTGANADERLPIRPGDELKVALAVAHELVIVGGHSGPGGSAAASALSGYSVEKVAEELGLENGAAKIKALANALWSARGRSLVLGGGVGARGEYALGLQVAVNFLNSLLENEGKTVDGTNAVASASSGYRGLAQLVREMKSGEVDVLIIQGINPVYGFNFAGLGFEEALKKVPFVVTVADRENETALASDAVAAESHFLEAWGDASPRRGVMTLQQPTLHPLHDTRSFEDCLLAWARSAGLSLAGIAGKSEDAHAYLKNYWKDVVFPQAGSAVSFQQFWEGVLQTGVWEAKGAGSLSQSRGSARSFQASALTHWPKSGEAKPGARISFFSSVAMGDGEDANNPWLQELPDPVTSITWDNALNLGVAAAKSLGVEENDVVEVTVGEGKVELPVHIQPGLHPQTVATSIGYGRRSVGKIGDGAGVDVYPLVQWKQDGPVFCGLPVSLRKTGRVYRLASTQWHFATEDRPVVNDVTLAQFRKNPGVMSHTDPELKLEKVPTMWSTHEYKGHRWGMAIDLTSCIGCNACMISCQAENNIPVVGRQQVRNSRQMHWIKIDRYYSGNPENPDVVFQPMLCQHCENAPCETVCPVLATVHDDEGLNVQVYNRCVGTRYCQNNCPYKVRRFNFFDHWKAYEGTMNLAWNPDVTVRTRGIMEKCTFCVQRIRESKENAKDVGEKVRDGDVKTACQQTCPTDAIVFGDLNDPGSRVAKMKSSPQSFRVLEIIGTGPAVSYMTKVRNKEATAHQGGH